MRTRRLQGGNARNTKENAKKNKIDNIEFIAGDVEKLKEAFLDIRVPGRSELVSNKKDLYIEIGMGKGDFIIQNALTYPNINFIGIEKYSSVLARAVQKLENQDIPNLKLIRMDAKDIEEVFSKEVSRIYLNFSDPWPKKRQAKRRLTSEDFLRRYDSIFKNTKEIIFKTDNMGLFEFSIESLSNILVRPSLQSMTPSISASTSIISISTVVVAPSAFISTFFRG